MVDHIPAGARAMLKTRFRTGPFFSPFLGAARNAAHHPTFVWPKNQNRQPMASG